MGPDLIVWILAWALITPGLWLWARLVRAGSAIRFRAPDSDRQAQPQVRLSIIIPARDEEHNLPALLKSIASQVSQPDEVIVVDDGSSDRTAEVSRLLGATVIPSEPLPEGWRGKTWACHQGAQAARGDLLLFIDADTWFEPDSLSRILAGYDGGALSVGPHHVIRSPHENLSLFFNLNMVLGTVPDGLFGQMMLVDRESYQNVGGHAAVKERILENFWLAEKFRAMDIPTRSRRGRRVFSFRMYPGGLSELVSGWMKGFAAGAAKTPPMTLIVVVLWMIGLMLAAVAGLATGDWIQWGLVYGIEACLVWLCGRRVGTFSWLGALCYPVPLVFFFVIFAGSVARSGRPVQWKGREIRAD